MSATAFTRSFPSMVQGPRFGIRNMKYASDNVLSREQFMYICDLQAQELNSVPAVNTPPPSQFDFNTFAMAVQKHNPNPNPCVEHLPEPPMTPEEHMNYNQLEFFTEFDTYMLNKELGVFTHEPDSTVTPTPTPTSSSSSSSKSSKSSKSSNFSWADSVEEDEKNGTHTPLSSDEILELSMSMTY